MGQNDLCGQYAAAALKMAIDDAVLDVQQEDKNNIGIIMGCSCGGAGTLETSMQKFLVKGEKKLIRGVSYELCPVVLLLCVPVNSGSGVLI